MSEQIESWGASSIWVDTGNEACCILKEAERTGNRYHIAIISSEIPDETLDSVVGTLRSDPTLRETLLAVQPAEGQSGDMERLRSSGVDAFISSPIRPWQLYETLSSAWTAHLARKNPMPALVLNTPRPNR